MNACAARRYLNFISISDRSRVVSRDRREAARLSKTFKAGERDAPHVHSCNRPPRAHGCSGPNECTDEWPGEQQRDRCYVRPVERSYIFRHGRSDERITIGGIDERGNWNGYSPNFADRGIHVQQLSVAFAATGRRIGHFNGGRKYHGHGPKRSVKHLPASSAHDGWRFGKHRAIGGRDNAQRVLMSAPLQWELASRVPWGGESRAIR